MDKLNILFAASEVVPFAKTGGLADVAGALPKALRALGHDVRLVMPRYYIVDREKYSLRLMEGSLGVPMGTMGEMWAGVYEGVLPATDIPIYFIDYEHYFGRSGLYDENGEGFSDNDNRFLFFSRAVMQLAKKLHFHPDVIHANDWHTAAIPMMLNTLYAYDPHFAYTGSLLTIHNLQHQGKFYKGVMDVLGIGWEHYFELEEHGSINLLKGGIVHADAISTVSSKYAQEIRTAEFGWGLEGLIDINSYKLHGILNGVDYEEWSPAVDSMISYHFDIDDMMGKGMCKNTLQQLFNLPQRGEIPLIGFVGRLAEQKGIELIASSIHKLLEMDIQIVMLGAGEKWAESFFSEIAGMYPHKFGCFIGYRNDIAHQIEAGSDLFLMPSLFEPCGLNQIYSLRYGTLPIVRATGGLDDTIENYHNDGEHGNGFKFHDATPEALINTVGWAVYTWYNDHDGFKKMQHNAMSQRYDWEGAAHEYESLYRRIIHGRKGV
ncbi:MAG: glycogen/starch synthase [Sulfuricurvum sp.]|uniref:glycogen synthase n=1 Tax=Sulfuricurvum sp. TaxID=2025608 RepID=UPI00262AC13D|nr:glycogen/starch synthase [Sulfuricurvum sp.]MDD2829488.1 glycogen/starch synthase [Sulfuricurvum sp.]MDD4949515.1 glycogen/starch synthase [Sulfuricurvum sp.]